MAKWNLNDLYLSVNDEKIISDLTSLSMKTNEFACHYKNKLHNLDQNALTKAIINYEDIVTNANHLMSYAFLNYSTNLNNPEISKFYKMINENINPLIAKIAFFDIEISKLDDDVFIDLNFELMHYEPWYRQIRKYKPYYLSEDLEKILIEKNVINQSWIQLFDETIANIIINHDDDDINLEQALHLLQDLNPGIRESVAKKISAELNKNHRIFTITYNALVKDKSITDNWRYLPMPQSSQHIANEINNDVVEFLVNTIKENYKELSHQYYKLKAKILKLDKLHFWDRNASIDSKNNVNISYQDAQKIVLESYHAFCPFMSNIAKMFFDNNWIDAELYDGKMGGGFAHPSVPNVHPYILINYQGSYRDVMTLAHEIGHGIHQYLSASQGMLVSNTQLVLSETASIFGEMLTFENLLSKASDSNKVALLSSKIEDKINTVVRQISFYDFECKIHNMRKISALSFDDICNIWMETQRESLGENITLTDEYRSYWCYISHFIHSPFYVYSYAFSDCIVNSLYKLYNEETNKNKFIEQYLSVLANGGRLKPQEVAKKFGLNLNSKSFWEESILPIKNRIADLENIIKLS